MSRRDDLYPSAKTGWRRLSYTRRCGFVDWGHALPDGPASLKRQLDQQVSGNRKLDGLTVTLEGAPAFVVEYGQSMGSGALVFPRSRTGSFARVSPPTSERLRHSAST